MSRKRRKSRVATPAPRGTRRDSGGAAGRRGRRLTLLVAPTALLLALLGLAVALHLHRRDDAGRTAAGPSPAPPRPAPAVADLPPPLVDPGRLVVPDSLSPGTREEARRAMALHRQALDAHAAGDVAAFVRVAGEALAAYGRANWLPAELGSFLHEYMAIRFKGGDDEGVVRGLEAWLERYPDSPDHLELLGLAHHRRGAYAAAARCFEREAALRPPSAKALRRLASVYASLGAKEKGLATVDRMLELVGYPRSDLWSHPEAEATIRVAVMVAHRFYDYRRLAPLAEAFLARFPDDPDATKALGVALRNEGDHARAEALLRRYLERAEPDDGDRTLVRFELGIAILKQRRARDALLEFTRLLLEDPYSGEAYFQLGQCLARLGRPELADGMFRVSRDLAPGDREFRRERELSGAGRAELALRHRAMGFALLGRFRKGKEVLEDAAGPAAGPAVLVYLAEYLVDTLDVAAAREALERLEGRVGPASSDVRGWRARALILEGRPEEAAAILADLCRQRDLLQVWGPALATALLDDLGRPGEAARWLETILEAGPVTRLQALRGRTLFEAGEAERAAGVLERIPPQEDEWRQESGGVWLARCRVRLGTDLERAREDLFDETTRWPPTAALHLARAEWLERAGADGAGDDAGGDLRERARAEREAAARIGRLEEKYREHRRRAALGRGRERAAALLEAARARSAIGDRAGAIRHARLAIAGDPESAGARQALLDLLDRPEEVFFRAEAGRGLGAAPRAEDVAAELAGETTTHTETDHQGGR